MSKFRETLINIGNIDFGQRYVRWPYLNNSCLSLHENYSRLFLNYDNNVLYKIHLYDDPLQNFIGTQEYDSYSYHCIFDLYGTCRESDGSSKGCTFKVRMSQFYLRIDCHYIGSKDFVTLLSIDYSKNEFNYSRFLNSDGSANLCDLHFILWTYVCCVRNQIHDETTENLNLKIGGCNSAFVHTNGSIYIQADDRGLIEFPNGFLDLTGVSFMLNPGYWWNVEQQHCKPFTSLYDQNCRYGGHLTVMADGQVHLTIRRKNFSDEFLEIMKGVILESHREAYDRICKGT